MIYNVPIPTKVSRMGCTPGGNCCDDCRSHAQDVTGPPIGSAATHVHHIPTMRNAALRGALGDTQCDQDGNCYDSTTGQLLSAPLTTGVGCPPGVETCGASIIANPSTWIIGVGLIALYSVLGGGGGRRR